MRTRPFKRFQHEVCAGRLEVACRCRAGCDTYGYRPIRFGRCNVMHGIADDEDLAVASRPPVSRADALGNQQRAFAGAVAEAAALEVVPEPVVAELDACRIAKVSASSRLPTPGSTLP
jgi:hypothetical protein